MVKLITTTVSYYLGYKTGQFIIPPLSKFVQNNKTYQQLIPKIKEKYNKTFGLDDKNKQNEKSQDTTPPS